MHIEHPDWAVDVGYFYWVSSLNHLFFGLCISVSIHVCSGLALLHFPSTNMDTVKIFKWTLSWLTYWERKRLKLCCSLLAKVLRNTVLSVSLTSMVSDGVFMDFPCLLTCRVSQKLSPIVICSMLLRYTCTHSFSVIYGYNLGLFPFNFLFFFLIDVFVLKIKTVDQIERMRETCRVSSFCKFML